ncbi:unnamed protein product [[Candida] boidinii]|uniref:Unnamed protein product n=1 Tax=Candida boidinii TaxID=5477 RepID=A0A9W6WI58_CANBO|nr:hypothetical protein B5S30_g5770 [[Candida] boidinii]GME74528.1 unnamed protein product [[Candida] boidinii]
MADYQKIYQEAEVSFNKNDINKTESLLIQIIDSDNKSENLNLKTEKLTELKESSILKLGKLYSNNDLKDKLIELIKKSCLLMSSFAKSKTSKILKTLIDLLFNLNDSIDLTIDVLNYCINWSIEEKRTFLRQSLQLRLSNLFYLKKNYNESLNLLESLLKEFKKLDDKNSLVEVLLLESKIYFNLKNFSKSKSCLTSAKTSANSIYCPTKLQGELDLMSGILLLQDKDFTTAFSYFFESFENFQLHNDSETNLITIKVLKYMILSKIMINALKDIDQILSSINKNNITNTTASSLSSKSTSSTTTKTLPSLDITNNKEIEAMKSIAKAYENNSLKELEDCLKFNSVELTQDVIIRSHLNDLYDSLYEKNLLKLFEPYSCIEISHISSVIGLPIESIESKISSMILDKKFYGVLDQSNGWLIIYDEPKIDQNYDLSLNILKNMSAAVDSLYNKASLLD